MVYETNSAKETAQVGIQVSRQAQPGSVYALAGDLGAGKTAFTQGMAQGLGITQAVCSPTFNLIQIYEEGRIPLYHFDVYRITDIEEMYEIGYEDYFYGNGVTVIEWAKLVEELLPPAYIQVTIEKDLEKGFDFRRITIEERKGSV